MRARVLGVLLLATLVGVGGGLGVGYLRQPQPASGGTATPVPAVSPSVPVDPPATWRRTRRTSTTQPLTPGLRFQPLAMGNSVQTWRVPVPKGWAAFTVPGDEPVPRKQRGEYDELGSGRRTRTRPGATACG